jgi:hypothetical protein
MKYALLIYHNDPGLVGGRSEQRLQLLSCLGPESYKTLKWNNGSTCPANWNGYTNDNPSPGRDLHHNVWTVECDEEELLMIVLKTGAITKPVQVDSLAEV